MDGQGHSDEVSGGNEEHSIGQRRKGHLCKVVMNLAGVCLCSSVLWKVEFVNDESGYSDGKTLKQSVEGATWFPLAAYSKM